MKATQDMLNPTLAKFAALYVAYGNATRAYGEAHNSQKTDDGVYPNWVSVEGHRTLRMPKVRAEIDRITGTNAALSTLSSSEVLDWLVAAITTPVSQIGPDSPLCEEYTVETVGPLDRVKCKSVSKIAAVRELMRLTGMAAPQQVEISAESSVLEMIQTLTGAKPTK
jgi:hypothetical protein